MKRVILLFAAVLLASIGWSQTMVITLNDGTTVKYDMGIVKSIEFTDEDSGNGQESTPSIVGTWVGVNSTGWGLDTETDGELPILQINADGTYINIRKEDGMIIAEHGEWTLEDSKFVRYVKDGDLKGTVLEYTVVTLTSETLQFRCLGFTTTFRRVSDSVIEKYL